MSTLAALALAFIAAGTIAALVVALIDAREDARTAYAAEDDANARSIELAAVVYAHRRANTAHAAQCVCIPRRLIVERARSMEAIVAAEGDAADIEEWLARQAEGGAS